MRVKEESTERKEQEQRTRMKSINLITEMKSSRIYKMKLKDSKQLQQRKICFQDCSKVVSLMLMVSSWSTRKAKKIRIDSRSGQSNIGLSIVLTIWLRISSQQVHFLTDKTGVSYRLISIFRSFSDVSDFEAFLSGDLFCVTVPY